MLSAKRATGYKYLGRSPQGTSISAATGYEHLSSHRVRASQQPQGTRVPRQLQDVSFSAATGCEFLGISLGVSISAMI